MLRYELLFDPQQGYDIAFYRDAVWYDERCNENAVDPFDVREAHQIAQSMLAEYLYTEFRATVAP